MDISINGLQINNPPSYGIEPGVQGLGKPGIRTTSGNFSGRDGGYVSSQFFAPREIVIRGFYRGDTCDDADTLRQELQEALPIRQSLPMFVSSPGGTDYYLDVYLTDMKMDFAGMKFGKFELTLLAPDPYLYDPGDGVDPDSGFITQTFFKVVGGGYDVPYILPVEWDAGTTPTIVNNTGDVYILPQIVLAGAFTNPIVRNITTGAYFGLTITTTGSDEIIIDMKQRTVTLNGGSIAAYRTEGSTWWYLQPGNNSIRLDTDSGSDDDSGTIRYRIAFEGM